VDEPQDQDRTSSYAKKWDGGYVRIGEQGRPVYIIRQMINGKRYDVSTRAHTERAALEQWKRFQADPENYDPRGKTRPDPIHLNAQLAKELLAYSKEEKNNSMEWRRKQRKLLDWWAKKLKGVDLRGASIPDVLEPAVRSVKSRAHRIAILKGVYTWLRTVKHRIDISEDPTAAGAWKVPQCEPEQLVRVKSVPRERVKKVRGHLAPSWRDALDLQAATGWHVTEVQRFASSGEIETKPQPALGIAAVVIVRHKSGDPHRTGVDQATLEVARRIRERGGVSREHYYRAVQSACKAAGLKKKAERFSPGQLRHSVATWAIDDGCDLGTVSTFLGHKSASTTRKFYTTHATPKNPMIVVPVSRPPSFWRSS
jgi:integrase